MKVARTTSGKYVVDALVKALEVLEAFTDSSELALNEISRRVGLNKSRTFRLLYTLAEKGYVERSGDGLRYKLGVKLFERAANVRRDVRDVARPFMKELQERFNEMVNLGVLDREEVLYLDIVETSRAFRMSASVGCRMPAHRTSMGKAILANLHADDSTSPGCFLLAKVSRQEVAKLRSELQLTRERGYAIDNEDNERGVACIGAAVMDSAGNPVAALSVSGPVHRILEREKVIAPAVISACKGMSRNLALNGGGITPVVGVQLSRGVAVR
jgi:DNA-binding IclR family transcriptional regulator